MANNKSNLGNISQIFNKQTESFINIPDITLPFSTITGGVYDSPAIGVTSIQNRSPLPDPENDLGVKFGVERVFVKKIERVDSELGPKAAAPNASNQLVSKDPDDIFDRIRFIGEWKVQNGWTNNSLNLRVQSNGSNTNEYIEITFYGTGLNLLTTWDSPGYDYRYSLDGAAESGNFIFSGLGALNGTITANGWPAFQSIEVVKNLTQGLHTIKIRNNDVSKQLIVYGYDILNETSTIRVEEGEAFHRGKKIFHPTSESLSINSSFESGFLGTKGGNVSVYIKEDGTVKKSLTPVDETSRPASTINASVNFFTLDSAAPADWQAGTMLELDDGTNRELVTVTSSAGTTVNILNNTLNAYNTATVLMYAQCFTQTNHINEEIIDSYHFREFGNSNGQDFANLTTVDTTSMVLSDNSTVLIGKDVLQSPGLDRDSFNISSDGEWFSFSFTGTGLDIDLEITNGSFGPHSVYVDGEAIGTMSGPETAEYTRHPICSNLPYGQHTVFINKITGSTAFYNKFVVYAPKKPNISEDYLELGSYFLTSDHKRVTNDYTVGPWRDLGSISRGTIRKHATREWQYRTGPNDGGTGSDWALITPASAAGDYIGGYMMQSSLGDVSGNPIAQVPFFGTGFDFRHQTDVSNAVNLELYLIDTDGTRKILNTANFGAAATNATTSTGVTFTAGTGILDVDDATTRTGVFSVTGLPLGQYTFGITNLSPGANENLKIEALDIITPVHSHVNTINNSYDGEIRIGSNSISDSRQFGFVKKINNITPYYEAVGNTFDATTGSGTYIPLPEMRIPIILKETKLVEVDFSGAFNHDIAEQVFTTLYINGENVFDENNNGFYMSQANISNISWSKLVRLPAGTHMIQVFWKVSTGTGNTRGTSRKLTVKVLN